MIKIQKRQIIRWYLCLIPLFWIILFMASYLWDVGPNIGNDYALFIWGLQASMMLVMMIASGHFFIRMLIENKKIISHKPLTDIKQLVILPCYKEPIAVLCQSIRSLQQQSLDPKNNIILLVSFEAKRAELEKSKQILNSQFADAFFQFDICVHPAGVKDEIPGKCSNEHFAVKYILSEQRQGRIDFDINKTLLTIMDADTLLHKRYLEYIANDFVKHDHSERFNLIWQAALFYNWHLNSAAFFTRITALFRTIWMIGFNIPFQVHAMSVYSSSLTLCIDNHFFDPSYQMEDMHYFVSSMNTRKGAVKLRPVYLPIICGPTSGANWQQELYEWYRQAKRWSIGAFEVFHYICIKSPNMGLGVSSRLAFTLTLLYGIFQSIIFFATLIAYPVWYHYQDSQEPELWYLLALIPWLFIVWVYLIDRLFVSFFEVKQDKVSLFKNLAHILLTPLVLLCYNLVSFLSLHILAIYGKAVCGHDPSEKSHLKLIDNKMSEAINKE